MENLRLKRTHLKAEPQTAWTSSPPKKQNASPLKKPSDAGVQLENAQLTVLADLHEVRYSVSEAVLLLQIQGILYLGCTLGVPNAGPASI